MTDQPATDTARARGTGLWAQAGVPHRGWSCEGVSENEDMQTCEMCDVMAIRYVHHMTHPDYPRTLEVGCVCAEHMENDYVGPRRREAALKRRQGWLRRAWRTSWSGNDYITTASTSSCTRAATAGVRASGTARRACSGYRSCGTTARKTRSSLRSTQWST
jgi:hypothetical protein